MSSHNHYRDTNERQAIKMVEDENEMINKVYIMEYDGWKNRSRTSSKTTRRLTEVVVPTSTSPYIFMDVE
jgi:hypothetical protein